MQFEKELEIAERFFAGALVDLTVHGVRPIHQSVPTAPSVMVFFKNIVFSSLSAGKDIGFSISWAAERRKVNNESIPDNEVISRGFPCY